MSSYRIIFLSQKHLLSFSQIISELWWWIAFINISISFQNEVVMSVPFGKWGQWPVIAFIWAPPECIWTSLYTGSVSVCSFSDAPFSIDWRVTALGKVNTPNLLYATQLIQLSAGGEVIQACANKLHLQESKENAGRFRRQLCPLQTRKRNFSKLLMT